MSPISNKQRGKFFEEKIAKTYRDIFNLSKHECYRAGSSGARTTIEYNGDITFSDPIKYPIITECKYRKNLDINDIFPICNNEVNKWIEQALSQQGLYKKMFKKDPLTLIICGKPYMSNPWCILLYYEQKSSQFNHITFTSEVYESVYSLVSLLDLPKIFKIWQLIK